MTIFEATPAGRRNCDRLGVTTGRQAAAMMILLTCPWYQEDVPFAVDEADDELVCSSCDTRVAFAPDPVTTFSLLYEAA
jgi:hypothetical protein